MTRRCLQVGAAGSARWGAAAKLSIPYCGSLLRNCTTAQGRTETRTNCYVCVRNLRITRQRSAQAWCLLFQSISLRQLCGLLSFQFATDGARKAAALTREPRKLVIGNVTRINALMPNSPSYQSNCQRAGLHTQSTVACYRAQTLDRDSACGSDGSESVADQDEGAEVLPSSRC